MTIFINFNSIINVEYNSQYDHFLFDKRKEFIII